MPIFTVTENRMVDVVIQIEADDEDDAMERYRNDGTEISRRTTNYEVDEIRQMSSSASRT